MYNIVYQSENPASDDDFQNFWSRCIKLCQLLSIMETAKSRRQGAKQVRSSEPKSMSSWLERQAASHNVQLAATAVLSGAVVAGLIYSGQAIRRKAAVDELKASIPELDESHHADLVIISNYVV